MQELNKIVYSIQDVLSCDEKTVALHEPCFRGNEWKYVKECLDTGWVSSVGKFVDQFEKDLAQFTQAKYVIATSNGTSALHIAYMLAGVQPNDEVLVPTMTFVATTNALSYCGGIPHFIDTEITSLGINADLLDQYLESITEKNKKNCINRFTHRTIRALCVMHTLGHPADLDALTAVCNKYGIALIEDAAEALGSSYKNTHVGHHGVVGILSFNGNKIMTTGGGGAILTNNEALAKRAKHLTTTAKISHPFLFDHDEMGYNYRLPNMNAALGCAQLEQVPQFLNAKRKLAEKYQAALNHLPEITFITEPPHGKSNYWLNAILLDESLAPQRDKLIELFIQHKIMVRPLWKLQHTLPMYRDCPRMPLPISENIEKRLIKLPSSPRLILENETT